MLQAISGSKTRRDDETFSHQQAAGDSSTTPQQPAAPVPSAPSHVPEPARPMRGRGGFIQRQLAARAQATGGPPSTQVAPSQPTTARDPSPTQAPVPGRSSSGDGTTSSSSSRRDSSGSRSSILSEQFKPPPPVVRSALPKGPSNAGAQITLGLNYMTFRTESGIAIQEYHVEFKPDIESIRLRYKLLRSEEAEEKIGSVIHWTGTNLYLPTKLPDKHTIFETRHPVTEQPVKVRLTFVKTPPDDELLPFYNSLMHKVMNRLQYVIINRQHYSPLHKIEIQQHRLEVWPGWLTSIQRLDGGIKLTVDATFRVLRLQTVLDLMTEIKNRNRGTRLKELLETELIGTIIMTRYNNRSYRIDEIDMTRKASDTFTMSNGEEISYADYILNHYNVRVRDLNQPMIVNHPKPKRGQPQSSTDAIYLIPELCVTTGLTDDMRANFNIMKAIGEHTRLPPDVRESKLVEFLQQMATDERARSVLEVWGLSVQPNLDVVPGRRLDTETVIFGSQKSYKVDDNADWTRPATGGPVFKSVDIENWVLMCPESAWKSAEDLMQALKDVCRNLQIKFSAPRLVRLPNENTTSYVNAGKQHVRRGDQMVVILTPGRTQREDRYSACKRLYTCEIAVPCQFIRCGTIANERKIRSICQKVAIQILAKVGGQPWAMKFPMKSFMIIGIDTYHDTIDRNKSCVGFVASMNEFTSSWWSQTSFQNSLEEIGQKISFSMMSALRRYQLVNGFIPQRIIVYRDGVGDGQLETVLNTEIAQIMSSVKMYLRDTQSEDPLPSISYIIVQKRINTKMSLRAGNRSVNPQPGSYIDHTITHPDYNDFYLVSQHVNQGTVSPTKYIVLTETGTLKMEHHQKLAYKMTHMYYNWCGTIRVPAPCQYAHKLAYLTGQNIRAQASERLEDRLYYL